MLLEPWVRENLLGKTDDKIFDKQMNNQQRVEWRGRRSMLLAGATQRPCEPRAAGAVRNSPHREVWKLPKGLGVQDRDSGFYFEDN